MRFAKVYIEIINQCNLNCSFCPKTKRKPAKLNENDFETILQRLQGYTEFLYFHIMGEPLLHPALNSFFDLAEKYGYRVILTTNGTLLTERAADLLRAESLHKVNVSLHSFEANEAAGLQGYLISCCRFAKQASEMGILVNLRLWNLDGKEIAGINSRNTELLQMIESGFPNPWQKARDGFKLMKGVYLVYGERFAWPDMQERDRGERRFCYGLKDQIGVLCDGTVVPCCLDHEGDIPLGNLLCEGLEEILEKPRTKAMIRGFQDNRAIEELCRRCGYSTRFLPNE